jgi:hypothetical protein
LRRTFKQVNRKITRKGNAVRDIREGEAPAEPGPTNRSVSAGGP